MNAFRYNREDNQDVVPGSIDVFGPNSSRTEGSFGGDVLSRYDVVVSVRA